MSLEAIVARNLRAARTQQKMSQAKLTRKCGLSTFYVSMIERGVRTPSLGTIELIAKALGVSPQSLFDRRKR